MSEGDKCPMCHGCGKVPNPEVNHSHGARRFIKCKACGGTGKVPAVIEAARKMGGE